MSYNTETMLPISEIRGDTIILKDSGLRAILKVTWLNIDLRKLWWATSGGRAV